MAGGVSPRFLTAKLFRGRLLDPLALAVAAGWQLLGAVALVLTAWRSLREVADGGDRLDKKVSPRP